MQEIIIAIICSSAFASVVTGIMQAVASRRRYESTEAKVIKFLLYGVLKEDAMKYIDNGYITPSELHDFSKGFELYTQLGGNGTVRKLSEEVMKLPLQDV